MIQDKIVYRTELELAIFPPRRVRFMRETQKRRLIAYVTWLLVPTALLSYGRHVTARDNALLARGKVATAHVVDTAAYMTGNSHEAVPVVEATYSFEFRCQGSVIRGNGTAGDNPG